MKNVFSIALFFCITAVFSQTKLELTPQGFQSLEIKTPEKTLDRLMELSKAWASFYNKSDYDVSAVTANSLTIEAKNENAFYYYNVGVKYNSDIRYSMKISFNADKTYKLSISVKEIYAGNVLTQKTAADFFTAEGKVKEDYIDAKPSLENTINRIVKSFSNFIDRN